MGRTESPDPLKDLVMFLVYLAVVALLATLFVYFTSVLPAQHAAAMAPASFLK